MTAPEDAVIPSKDGIQRLQRPATGDSPRTLEMDFVRTLLDSLKLTFLLLPNRPARRIGPRAFWLAGLLATALLALDSFLAAESPRAFNPGGFQGAAFACLLTLLLAYASAIALKRPALLWPLATLLLLEQIWIDLAIQTPAELWILPALGVDPAAIQRVSAILWAIATVLAAARTFDYLEPYRGRFVRKSSGVAVAVALLVPLYLVGTGMFFYTAFDPDLAPEMQVEAAPISFDPERLMMRQDELVDSAVASLAPNRPGQIDLYVLAFGGDGSENVFRNEVEYVDRLFEERFDARGRTLVLVNNDETVDRFPLATRANLDRALAGIGRVADPREDIVMLFFTSHGSEDHELYVNLEPLPLASLKPVDIASAIDEAAIGWRVVVVSACYSGGFIPALADEQALVITAARKDRTSFGCGAASEITYFGRAYFAEGLNRTPSLTEAFAFAHDRIRTWEKDEKVPFSYPQISTSPQIEERLSAWLTQLDLGPQVAFSVATEPSPGAAATPR